MLDSQEFRELLIADVALVRGLASARDVAAALQRYWEERASGQVSIADELAHIARVDRDALRPVEEEVDRIIASAGGSAEKAFASRGGLDRSIHVALSERTSGASQALSAEGASVRAPLREVSKDHYIDCIQAGEGGMGVVYATHDTELKRLVALKMVRPDGGRGRREDLPSAPEDASLPEEGSAERKAYEELKARFLQEAWVTGGMEHPGVVPVHELGQTECGIPYYTMRFLRGQRTLRDALDEREDAPIERRLELLEPYLRVCDTLTYAHAKGVIHRDLKPEHVALGEYGEVVVIDWGLARLEGRADVTGSLWQQQILQMREDGYVQTQLGGAMGTAGYMSPEAARGKIDEVDEKSDVFALGVILFEVLTGQAPYDFDSPLDYVMKVNQVAAPDPQSVDASVPPGLSQLCLEALDRHPKSRLATVRLLAEGIRAWQKRRLAEQTRVAELSARAESALKEAENLTGSALLDKVQEADNLVTDVLASEAEREDASDFRMRVRAL